MNLWGPRAGVPIPTGKSAIIKDATASCEIILKIEIAFIYNKTHRAYVYII